MDLDKLNSHELVRRCLDGSESQAWPEFVRRFSPSLKFAVGSRLRGAAGHHEDVEELVQQVYVHLCENDFIRLRRLLTIRLEAVAPYLRALAVNLVTDHLRKKTPLSRGVMTLTIGDGGVDPAAPDDRDRQLLFSGIDRHLENCAPTDLKRARAVFWLYYRAGLSSKEIAGISTIRLEEKGVVSMLHRLSDCVRRHIAEGKSNQNPSDKKGRGIARRLP